MKKLLSKGRVIVSFVSVFAVLAVSLLSMFAGVTFFASANDAESDGAVTYPLSGSYDADFVAAEEGESVYYTDAKGTEVSNFTGFATDFITYAEGSGSKDDPYIIKTANEFAAVVTAKLVDANGNPFSTEYVSFKVDESIKAFNLGNTDSQVDFSGDMTASEVEDALGSANVIPGLEWTNANGSFFMGQLNGNGVEVYGLKSVGTNAGIIPEASGNIKIFNITVKNSYFLGAKSSALVAHTTRRSTEKHAQFEVRNVSVHNNVILCNVNGEAIMNAGVLFGRNDWGDGANLLLDDSLVYGNIAKYTTLGMTSTPTVTREITYGVVGNMHRLTSTTMNNCIILDSAPHALYHGSNAFHNSTYTNVYTNMCDGKTWVNKDNNGSYLEYKYTYASQSSGAVNATFSKLNAAGEELANSGSPYSKTLAGPMFNVDPAKLTTGNALDGFDVAWNYAAGSYPTPKVYNEKAVATSATWSGMVASSYYEGDGTPSVPYIITTPEELAFMLMSDSQNKYYKLAKDIVINDTTADNWTSNARKWFTSNDVPEFHGILDGNGKTISGIYYDGSQDGEYAGLIPVIGSPGVVKKLAVANSSLTAKKGAVGGIVGAVGEKAQKIINFNAIVVEDTVEFSGNAAKGGIMGRLGYSVVNVTDCITKSAGIFGESEGIAKVSRCISVDSYPFASLENVTAVGVYTNVDGDNLVYTDKDGNEVNGVTIIDVELMKGEAAASNMSGLGFPSSWVVVPGDFPAATGAEASAEGAKGEVWTGAVATKYAGGDGSAEKPYQIETAEQLARCILTNKNSDSYHYILTADIYLNDVKSPFWKDKVGCNSWYTQRDVYNNFKNTTFDGDGYVIYGLFIDHTGPQPEYIRTGLFPQLDAGCVVKNVAISEGYMALNPEIEGEDGGFIVGLVNSWNTTKWKMEAKDANKNAITRQDPEYQEKLPKIINCVVDHTCYSEGKRNGGIVGMLYGTARIENCLFTGSMKIDPDYYWGGTLVGVDSTYSSEYIDTLSLPQTCNLIAGGSSHSKWRTSPDYYVSVFDGLYYFATANQAGAPSTGGGITKILKPEDRIGTAAQEIMTDLDWVDEYSQDYYDNKDATTWLCIDDGTPIPSIFAKHREGEKLLEISDRNFSPPEVKVSFMTNTDEVVLDDLYGRMYSKLELPIIKRDGFIFTGWYVFDDLSIEYPKDYFPPRDIQLFAGWEADGITQNFENYTDTIWDYDNNYWRVNKPGAKGGYKNAYVRNGAKSMRLLDTNTEAADFLINYEEMLEPGQAYTLKFWVATDKADNPTTLLTLVHNEKPVYLDTQVAAENMAVVTGLKVGEWVQYSYSFTAQTKWVSIRATAGSSLYFDDIVVAKIDGKLNGGNLIGVNSGNGTATNGTTTGSNTVTGTTNGVNTDNAGLLSPSTGDAVTIAVLISAIMACAVIAVISKKNLVEVID